MLKATAVKCHHGPRDRQGPSMTGSVLRSLLRAGFCVLCVLYASSCQAPVYGGFDDSGNYGVTIDGSGGTLYIRLPELSVLVFQKR